MTDSGSGIAVSPSGCFFVEQMAADGLNLFLSTNPFKTPTNTVSGITSIDLLNNKIIGSVTITDPEGIAILAGPAQLVSNLIAAVQGMNITGQGTSLTD